MIRTRVPAAPNDTGLAATAESPYRTALRDTAATIRRRTHLYRALAALVLLIPLSAVGVAIARGSASWIAVAVAVVPAFGLFRCADLCLLWRWERDLITLWCKGNLEFADFGAALTTVRSLPRTTVQAMLAILPQAPAIAERGLSSQVRADVAHAMRLISAAEASADVARTVGRCAFVTSIGLAVIARTFRPSTLVIVFGALGLELGAAGIRRGAVASWRRRVDRLGNRAEVVRLAGQLDWRSLRRER